MKITFLAEGDAANVLTEYSHCINKHSDNIQSTVICSFAHPFNYKIKHDINLHDCNSDQLDRVKQIIIESDIIIFAEEGLLYNRYKTIDVFNRAININLLELGKKVIIWHPGTNYRENYHTYNNHPLRNKIYKHLYAIDLYRLSPKKDNDTPLLPYQYFNFNYSNYIKMFKQKLSNLPWTILHIPSNASIKGTSMLQTAINKLDLDPKQYKYKVLQNISHSEVIIEKQKSLFYLDQINETCGGYGLASLEALLLSNLTFSTINNSSDSLYKLTGKYETPVIPLTNNERELKETLTQFIKNISKEEMLDYIQGIGKWIEDAYSPKNIVKQFKELIA